MPPSIAPGLHTSGNKMKSLWELYIINNNIKYLNNNIDELCKMFQNYAIQLIKDGRFPPLRISLRNLISLEGYVKDEVLDIFLLLLFFSTIIS